MFTWRRPRQSYAGIKIATMGRPLSYLLLSRQTNMELFSGKDQEVCGRSSDRVGRDSKKASMNGGRGAFTGSCVYSCRCSTDTTQHNSNLCFKSMNTSATMVDDQKTSKKNRKSLKYYELISVERTQPEGAQETSPLLALLNSCVS